MTDKSTDITLAAKLLKVYERENVTITELLKLGSLSVSDDVRFAYHVEVIRLFGKSYKAHMRAVYMPDDNWCVWFPKFYPNGDWDNKLLNDGTLVVMDRKKGGILEEKYMTFPQDQPGQRIIFAHIKDVITGEKYYKFVGIFTELEGTFQKATCSRTSETLYFDGSGRFGPRPLR